MQILDIKNLAIPEIKIIRYKRFSDNRGYFSETFRKSDFEMTGDLGKLAKSDFTQTNEVFSKDGVIRGFHFQFNPYMGKMVRTLEGHMIDFALDIRKDSETFGKIVAYDMLYRKEDDYGEWIWVPPGFAHGNLLTQDSRVEYFSTGQHNPEGEVGISPLAGDIDWSLCDVSLKKIFDEFSQKARASGLLSDKDKNGLSLGEWLKDRRADKFIANNISL